MNDSSFRLIVFASVMAMALGCGAPSDMESSRKFQQAEAAFTDARSSDDFARVAGSYQEILDRGVVSGTVLFNQGNALLRSGQRGRAVAAYRQAQRFRPRDSYLIANLNAALGPGDSSGSDATVLDYFLFWQDWVSYREKFLVTTIVLGVNLLLGLIACMTSATPLWNRLALICVVLTVLAGISTAWDWYRFDVLQHGVVVQSDTVARKGNSDNYEPAFTAQLQDGTEFQLRERRGDWLLIDVPQAGEGWIPEHTAVVY